MNILMPESKKKNCKSWTLIALAGSLVGGCAGYPPVEEAQSPSASPAASVTPGLTAGQSNQPMPPVRPAVATIGPPPPSLANGYTDQTAQASYRSTPEYQEAVEYEAALDRYLTDPFIVANYLASEKLIGSSQVEVGGYGRLAILPFNDRDRPGQTTPLGRMIGAQMASRLTQLGYPVVEADDSARNAGSLAKAMIVGHYVVSQDRVFINARLMDTTVNHRVVSAVDYALPLDKTTLALVTGCFRQGQWVCRLP